MNLLCVFPDPNDGTSFWRGLGPINHLRQNFKIDGEKIDISFIPSPDPWHVYRCVDAVFLQRPFQPEHLIALEQAKLCGRKVWVDYDDDYFSVMNDNAAHFVYREEEIKSRIKKCIEKADVVTVSTEHIRQVYLQYNDNVVVIPNAIDEVMFSWRNPSPERQKKVLWRGTQVHQKGLMKYADDIVAVAQINRDWEWHFLGDNPWWLVDRLPKGRVFTHPHIANIPNYFKFMHDFGHSIAMVCEVDTSFTRGKSNIAWMEAAFSGAVTVAPAWTEWARCSGAYLEFTFKEALQECINSYKENFNRANIDWNYIQENLTLPTINQKRVEVLKSLLG